MIRRTELITICCVVLCVSACGPTMRIKPGELPSVSVPPQPLRLQAEHYVAAHINEGDYREIKTGPEHKRVVNVIERLAKAAGYPPRSFPVHLLDAGEEVNAAAFNGASIVVYKELLKRVVSDEELATVLGHEIGHIVASHYKDKDEEENRAAAVNIGSGLLGAAANIATSAAGYSGAADLAGDATEAASGAVGYGAVVGSFNRTQEYEADHLGLIIMAKAGYDPHTAIGFWQRADQIFGSSTSSLGAFFSTHPASSDRMTALQEALPYALKYCPEYGSTY